MIRFLLLFTFICQSSISVIGQIGALGKPPVSAQVNVGNIYGKIVDATTQKAIEGASVQIIQNKFDTISKKKKDHIISTKITNKKGEFNIEDLPLMSTFKLQVNAVSYKPFTLKVVFEMTTAGSKTGDMNSIMSASVKDLGNIKLTKDEKQLENVTVTALQPLLQMNLDKKVYNVEKDLNAAGGSAIDVIKNIPTLNVDLDGNVTLRNATPQIFIDGKPTTLTLDQIPADQIASLEIISNPSAKFDASGGGSGILNLILKKNRKIGYNGNLRANIDTRGKPGIGADFNVKQNKINLFASAQINSRKNMTTVTSERTDFIGSDTANIKQSNAPVTEGYFAFARTGIDYLVNNRTTLTFSVNLFRGKFDTKDLLNIYRDTTYNFSYISETAIRELYVDVLMKNSGAILGYKHNFAKAGRELTADLNFNQSSNTNTSDYSSQFYDANGNLKPYQGAEKATGGGNTKFYIFQTDYVSPVTATQKFETGIRIAARDYKSWNDNYIQDPISGIYILIPALSVNYSFKDFVYAGYGTYSQQLKNFSYQLGLRVESSNYEGKLLNTNEEFSYNYPFSLFPSFYLSQKIDKKQDIQINYSRKINRPTFFQILPFVDFSDSLNLFVGNPALEPEFTNLAELSYSFQYKSNHSLLATLYGKNTSNFITRYQYKDANTNPNKPDSVIYISYANASKSYTYGLELTGKNKITKWWDIVSNLNFFNVTLVANNIAGVENNEQFSWFAKLNNNFKLPKNFTIQLNADYQAKTILPANSGRGAVIGIAGGMYGQQQNIAQGYIMPIYGVDLAFKKDFLKNNAASLTLQIPDIFSTRTYETVAETPLFIQNNYRRREPEFMRLIFAWRFGKFDAALFKRKNMKNEQENMQNMQQVGVQ